ncbi:MAG: hypothetical protein Q4B54_12485 [Coriobacteriales bacterium]|nr:hypothetical protein [Coriobacteriales bacterium]
MSDGLWEVMSYLNCDSPVELSYRPREEVILACNVLGYDPGVVLAAMQNEMGGRKRKRRRWW